jgi:release factor glutamine methyltransferase
MTISIWLKESTKKLNEAEIPTPRLDALVLLEDVTEIGRAKLLAEPHTELTSEQLQRLDYLLSRRMVHEPISYIRCKKEFYGREFMITSAVLEPRPESETMIDELRSLVDLPNNVYIADVGTGSGALGITAQLELPEAHVDLIDIDAKALKVAKTNVDKFTLPISVLQSDLLDGSDESYDLLLCNLPYVPDDFRINTAATHEPKLAIYGGVDGLDLYRKLFEQIKTRPNKPLYLLFESLPTQHPFLKTLAQSNGYEVTKINDFILVLKRIHK